MSNQAEPTIGPFNTWIRDVIVRSEKRDGYLVNIRILQDDGLGCGDMEEIVISPLQVTLLKQQLDMAARGARVLEKEHP